MNLDVKTWMLMLEVVLGVAVFGMHFISDINTSKASRFISTQGFCSPIIPQLFRAELYWLEFQIPKIVDYFIMVYAIVGYLVGAILTLIDISDAPNGDLKSVAITKSVFALAIVVAIIVEIIMDLIKNSGGGRGGGGRQRQGSGPSQGSLPQKGTSQSRRRNK